MLEQHKSGAGFVHGDPEYKGRAPMLAAHVSHGPKIKEWGTRYGLLLEQYDVDEGPPKHISKTCIVAYADHKGKLVALKFA